MNKSIYLSPSLQENNLGVGNYGSEELRMNQIADVVENKLNESGVIVYRNKPDWSLAKTVEDSNKKSPAIHLAIHSNACDGNARGCEVYCHRFGGEGERLARLIYEEVSAITPTNDRGVKEGYNFYGARKSMYELERTSAPAALVEVAFHDNTADEAWIVSHIDSIGNAISKAVMRYFGIPLMKETPLDLDVALSVLQRKGLINSPDYWRQNAIKGKLVTGEYAAILIRRVAAFLMKNI